MMDSAWATTPDFVSNNLGAARRFVAVIRQAQLWCNDHDAETRQLNAAFTGLDLAVLATLRVKFATQRDPDGIQPWITAAAKYGLLPRSFPASDLFARV
jgi:ABC-type nitrate/sulfonate/bicarbonate transport system substrate-binding protein